MEHKNILPVTKISYSGLEFQNQKAKIKLGALTCHPPENQYNIRKHLKSLTNNRQKFACHAVYTVYTDGLSWAVS